MATANGTTSSVHVNGTSGGQAPPKIHLYTNHGCPFAQRAHITLEELKLPYEETIIDLTTPRPQWYLDINPRGLVPSIKYTIPGVVDEAILTESQIVSQFLCDSFPSHLLPATREDPTAPLRRARINFFVDTWSTKIMSYQQSIMRTPAADKDAKVDEWVAAIKKELEPLLADAGPFFGGSKELTFAEVMAAPFLLRVWAFAKRNEVIPASLIKKLDSLSNFGKWSKAVREHESVLKVWDEEKFVEGFLKKYGSSMEKIK